MTQALAKIIERSRRDKEGWRYTDIEKILAKKSAEKKPMHIVHARDAVSHGQVAQLVFHDGVWMPQESDLMDLPPDIVQGDAVQGYRMVLAGQTCLVTQPIELVFKNTRLGTTETPINLAIDIGANGRLTLLERHEGTAHAVCMDIAVTLAEQAKFVHGRILSQYGALLGRITATLAEGAYYDNFTMLMGNALTRNEINVTMQGALAQCALQGVMLLDDSHHVDTRICVTHAVPHGISNQVYKILADGRSRGVFQGKVIVAPNAQKTDSQQLCRTLLLSDQAEVDVKPELEIYADDVKCSHGSTIGDLDAEALFYMRARGVSEAEARNLLLRAFVDDVIEKASVPAWRDLFHAEIEEWFYERSQHPHV